MPVTVVVGERDAKFRALGERMAPLAEGRARKSSPAVTACRWRTPRRSSRRAARLLIATLAYRPGVTAVG